MFSNKLARLLAFTAFLAIGVTGCGNTHSAPDATTARDALSQALDLWKSGGSLTDLSSQTEIVMSDVDWKAGRQLADYRIVRDRDDGANLQTTVELAFKGKKPSKPREVTYIVGTSPVVTIHRD